MGLILVIAGAVYYAVYPKYELGTTKLTWNKKFNQITGVLSPVKYFSEK
jgi:hypothetical protein